jgi:hypothetical protein
MYTASTKAWMRSSTFSVWVLALEERYIRQQRKFVLIVDNCPSLSVNVKLTAVKLFFLPQNATYIVQPCDHGNIQDLKFRYKKLLQRKYSTAVEAKQDLGMNIHDACHLLRSAWSFMTSATRKYCFIHAGFLLSQWLNILKETNWGQILMKRSIVYRNY